MKRQWKVLVMLLSLALLAACSKSTNPETPDVEVLANHLDEMLADWAPTYSPDQLYTEIKNDNAPFILSVRASNAYQAAHLKGAVNVPFAQVADKSALDAAGVPTDAPIVDYCYTGHSGQAAAVILKAMGYDVTNLKFGMMAFYSDADNGGGAGGVAPFDYQTDPPNSGTEGIETTANELPASGTYELPNLNLTGDTPEAKAASAAQAWISSFPIISANDLFQTLNDGDASNDPVIISVRAASAYQAGHIPGAYNIPWRDIAKIDNLTRLDPTKDYVVYCYTGHTGQVATVVLKMLGYKAKNLKFGMMGWSSNPDYLGGVTPFNAQDVYNDISVLTLGQ